MAVLKVVAHKGAGDKAFYNTLAYVLQKEKADNEIDTLYIGPNRPDIITPISVRNSFLKESDLWGKHEGRLYQHYLISFHKDEKITHQEALDFAREFCEDYFNGYKALAVAHHDRDNVHVHIIASSVNYLTGKKFHCDIKDLYYGRDLIDQLCIERGLSVCQKGRTFDGQKRTDISSYNKNQYYMLHNKKDQSYMYDLHNAYKKAVSSSTTKDEFISSMKNQGWYCNWDSSKKYITFEKDNHRIRDKRLGQAFNEEINKESIIHLLEQNCEYEEIEDIRTIEAIPNTMCVGSTFAVADAVIKVTRDKVVREKHRSRCR